MRLQYISDLHLESYVNTRQDFRIPELQQLGQADGLLLAGDICQFDRLHNEKVLEFFYKVSRAYDEVFWIPGNHEYYNGSINHSISRARAQMERHFPNIWICDQEWHHLPDGKTTLYCATMWGDCRNADPMVQLKVSRGLNDYSRISMDNRRNLTTDRTVEICKETLMQMKAIMGEYSTNDFLVVTHHAPSILSIQECYRAQSVSYGWYSDFDDFILEYGQIKNWIHGHTHFPIEYQLGSCTVRCNAADYFKSPLTLRHFDI